MYLCSIYTLCEKHEESIYHLFFECFTALRIWSWVRQIFLTPQFSNKDDFLSFIKSGGSPLVELLKLVVITFSIWMIWRMRNYARFQDKIDVSRAISVIKDLTHLAGNSYKASMKKDMLDFNFITFFGINTRTGKVLCPLLLDGSSLHQAELKSTIMGLLGDFLVLLLVEVFYMRV